MTTHINSVIKNYFKKNKIRLREVADQLGMSPSNLTERLNSTRAITLDEFFHLYEIYGDGFAITIMSHYKSRMLFLERIKELIAYNHELQDMYAKVRDMNKEVFRILNDIESGIESFSDMPVVNE